MGRKRKYGWAKTKFKGFVEHPTSCVRYNPSDNDDIYFISFTHKSKEVSLFGESYIQKELTYNINPNEMKRKKNNEKKQKKQ